MKPDQKFQHTVQLYRKLNRPELSGSGFEGRAIIDDELQGLIRYIWKNQNDHSNIVGEFEELEVAGNIFESYDECPEIPIKASVRLIFNLPEGDGRFYPDIRQYIESAPSLSTGKPNPNVYLIEDDYLVGENDKPDTFQKLEAVWRLIVLLTELSDFSSVDTKTNKLLIGYLIKGSSQECAADPFQVSSELSTNILDHPLVDLNLLEEILNQPDSRKAHAVEKKQIFRASLIEVLRKEGGIRKSIDNAVAHWQDINECYEKNFETYISGFSYQEACQELATKQVELSQNLSKALHDIAGKLLGTPLSLAAVGGILKMTDVWIAVLAVLGVLLLSIILALTLDNQRRFFEMTEQSVTMVFDGYANNQAESLNKKIEEAQEGLQQQIDKIANNFLIYRIFVWIPAIFAITVFYLKFK